MYSYVFFLIPPNKIVMYMYFHFQLFNLPNFSVLIWKGRKAAQLSGSLYS